MATKTSKTATATVSFKEFQEVKTQLANVETVAKNNIALATFFANAQMNIDNRIMNTTFKGNVKNSFFWVVNNWKEILDLIKYIISVVKQVKDKLQELRDNAPTTPKTDAE